MILQESQNQSNELALSIAKALNSNKNEAIVAMFNDKVGKTKIKQLLAAAEKGKTVKFDIIEMHGKVKVPRYSVEINFTTNEVDVRMVDNKHYYGAFDFKVVE